MTGEKGAMAHPPFVIARHAPLLSLRGTPPFVIARHIPLLSLRGTPPFVIARKSVRRRTTKQSLTPHQDCHASLAMTKKGRQSHKGRAALPPPFLHTSNRNYTALLVLLSMNTSATISAITITTMATMPPVPNPPPNQPVLTTSNCPLCPAIETS